MLEKTTGVKSTLDKMYYELYELEQNDLFCEYCEEYIELLEKYTDLKHSLTF